MQFKIEIFNTKNNMRLLIVLLFLSFSGYSQPIYLQKNQDLQAVIDSAPDHAKIICNLNDTMEVVNTIMVNKPLAITGLQAALPDSLGDMPILQFNAPGAIISNFILHGNAQTVSQKNRAPLLIIAAGDFLVERGKFFNSSKEGVSIEADEEDLTGGVVRDIYGKGVMRDLVSINGGYQGKKVRNVLVENIRCDSCVLRGAVEVSNGTDNITVRKVYASKSAYAVDVQDHRKEFQVNQHIVIEDIFAIDCKMGLRTANADYGHHNLTVRNITAVRCGWPIDLSHTDQVTLQNVTIIDHASEKNPPVKIENCQGISVENVKIERSSYLGAGIEIINSSNIIIDHVIIENSNQLSYDLLYEANNGLVNQGLIIDNIISSETPKATVVFIKDGKDSTLKKYKVNQSYINVVNKAGF